MANCNDNTVDFQPETAKKKKIKTACIFPWCKECEVYYRGSNFIGFDHDNVPYNTQFIAVGKNRVYSISLPDATVECQCGYVRKPFLQFSEDNLYMIAGGSTLLIPTATANLPGWYQLREICISKIVGLGNLLFVSNLLGSRSLLLVYGNVDTFDGREVTNPGYGEMQFRVNGEVCGFFSRESDQVNYIVSESGAIIPFTVLKEIDYFRTYSNGIYTVCTETQTYQMAANAVDDETAPDDQ